MRPARPRKPYYNRYWRIAFRPYLLKEVETGKENEFIAEIEEQIAELKQIILVMQLYQRAARNKELRDVHGIIKLIDPKAPKGENRIVSKFLTYRHEPSNIDANRTGASDL